MIRLEDLHESQLAQLNLRWVPLSELYDEEDLDPTVDNDDLQVICYDGKHSLDPVLIMEIETMLNSGASREQMLGTLRDFVVDCETAGWLLSEGTDDVHVWGQLRTGAEDHGVGGY
jgi:hypothetical protein